MRKNHLRVLAAFTFFTLLMSLGHFFQSVGEAANEQSSILLTAVGPSGLTVRKIQSSRSCGLLTVGTDSIAMKARAHWDSFSSITVCEANLPLSTTQFSLDGEVHAVKAADPKRIIFLGDSGCVVKKKTIQNCNSSTEWPLAKIAQAAADLKPDLVIHVGDYHYRESDCPEGNANCKGSISGDNTESWMQDFLVPARPLLTAAPWIFVRGNHEGCKRAGYGWFQFLATEPLPADCTDITNPISIFLGDHTIHVIDSNDDANIAPSLDKLEPSKSSVNWVLSHRPFLTPSVDDESSGAGVTLPEKWKQAMGVLFAGHRHLFSMPRAAPGNPMEVITGNGGTQIETKGAGEAILDVPFDGALKTQREHGFLVADRLNPTDWQLTEYDASGAKIFVCLMKEKGPGNPASISCN